MFATVIKHEARLQAKTLAAILGIGLVVFAAGTGVILLPVPFVSGFGVAMTFGAVAFLAIATPVHLLERYARSMYGREGYLTHALPVSTRTLYWAKVTWAFAVWLVATLLAVALWGLTLLVQHTHAGGTVAEFVASARDALASVGAGPVALWSTWLVVGLFIYVVQLAWVVTFGMEERFRTLGWGGPVLVWFVAYLALQVVMGLAIFLVPVGITPDFSAWVFQSMLPHMAEAFMTNTDPGFIPMGWFPVLVVTAPVYIVWTLRSLRLHTSLR